MRSSVISSGVLVQPVAAGRATLGAHDAGRPHRRHHLLEHRLRHRRPARELLELQRPSALERQREDRPRRVVGSSRYPHRSTLLAGSDLTSVLWILYLHDLFSKSTRFVKILNQKEKADAPSPHRTHRSTRARRRGARGHRRDRLRRARAKRRRQAQPRRLFDPTRGLREAHPDVREDAGGRRRQLHPVLWRVGRAGARDQGRARLRHRRALARSGHGRAREREPRRPEVEEAVLQGDGPQLGRRLRRARRQPEEDQELERPPAAGRRDHHAESVHVGRRPLEHHGGVRRRGGSRARPTSRRRRTS